MADTLDVPAWIALFLGLYALATAMGELRQPGLWMRMLQEIERSAALSFVIGLMHIALGAAVYLVSPWRPGDWLSVAISVSGGLFAVEGMLILAAGDRFLGFARSLVARSPAAWAGLSATIGTGFIIAALARL
jgi:vacuolar-type H+-ATPase subunit I/STV1